MKETSQPVPDFLFQKFGIFLLFQHRESGIQVALYRISPQKTAAQAVYGADLGPVQAFQLLPPIIASLSLGEFCLNFFPDSVAHFRGSFTGKGYGHNVMGQHCIRRPVDATAQNMQIALHQHPCFAASGSRRHRHILIYTVNRPVLGRC